MQLRFRSTVCVCREWKVSRSCSGFSYYLCQGFSSDSGSGPVVTKFYRALQEHVLITTRREIRGRKLWKIKFNLPIFFISKLQIMTHTPLS